jgi:hypothetical protein
MNERQYKKMAGTAAVFVPADFPIPSPMERDGCIWSDAELSMPETSQKLRWKQPIESALALEGLEEYDPPESGDARYVNKLGIALVYIGKIRGWVALTDFT